MTQGVRALAAAATAVDYLTFRLAGERYGIENLKVQELRSFETPTALADAPDARFISKPGLLGEEIVVLFDIEELVTSAGAGLGAIASPA